MTENSGGFFHDSTRTPYRRPFGAVTTGESVALFLSAPEDEHIDVKLRLWTIEGERFIAGVRSRDGFRFTLKAPDQPCLLWYYFMINDGERTLYYGGKSGAGALYEQTPPDYQITVYDAGFTTPEWFKRGIVYQLFPDRFNRSGERGGLSRTSYHASLGRSVVLHERWDDDVLYSPIDGDTYYAPCDFYGGDLEGIREKLPYLESLGVTCIYLNPIFESPSNHRYNTSDYMRIDPVLGDDATLSRLVDDAAKRGIRLMLDGVFSHTGDDSVYFNKYRRYSGAGAYNSKASRYYEWYSFKNFPDEYKSWWGFKTLPEIEELTPSYVEFVKRVLERWAELGLTSWRLDVADELPDEFIRTLRETLKRLDGAGVLLGEVWEDASNKEGFGQRRGYVNGDELDSAMGYPFMNAAFDFLLGRADAHELDARLLRLRENYPKPFYDAQLNLIGSHDTVRALTALSEAPGRDALTREAQAAYSPAPDALERGRKRLMLASAMQFFMPGVPSIYYGDEAGMTGMADPFSRKTYPWGREDAQLISHYRKLCTLRRTLEALKSGGCATAAISDDVFAAVRMNRGETAVLVVNRGLNAAEVCINADAFVTGPDAGRAAFIGDYEEAISKGRQTALNGGLFASLAPLSSAIFVQTR